MTLPVLHCCGTLLWSMLCWKMIAKGYATCTASYFSNLGCTKSAPGALSVLRSCSFLWTSAAPIVMSAINSTWHSRLGMFVRSSVVKTELKNSLSSIAISFGSSIRLPFMSRSGPICSLVLNLDLAYEKNDLESFLISAASFISKSPLAFFAVFVALLSAFRYRSWSSALPVCLYFFHVSADGWM